jgi:alpha-beta hydrolase superfamily lysophospholipase
VDCVLTTDRLRLHVQRWPVPAPRGTLLIVHGLGEHIARHAALATTLNAAGWSVVGYDQRGHGRSDGARGALAAHDSLLCDLALLVDRCRETEAAPLVLLGHSMGGLTAARFVAEALAPIPAPWSRPIDALVLSSPALAAGMTAFQKLLLAVLGPLAPNLAVSNGLEPAWISRDPAVVQAYVDDPLRHDRITPRLARFIVAAGVFVRQYAARWRVPTLLLYAGADRCVLPAGARTFAALAPPAVVTTREYADLYHEIFNEPERARGVATLESWLAARGTLHFTAAEHP